MNTPRKVIKIIEPNLVIEGAGVLLRRSIAPNRANLFDPFLLFDHFAFNDPVEGPIRGFPMHPHRGIETVTYMQEGTVNHRDSLGNQGLIGPGDVQWMSAGRGILHEEMPRRSPQGTVFGFQLWVNLPAAQKMSPPRYQEVSSATIPTVDLEAGLVRIVAGDVNGVSGPVTDIAARPIYLDVQLDAGGSFRQAIPQGHTAVAYLYSGKGEFGLNEDGRGELVAAVNMIVLSDGDYLEVRAAQDSPAHFMLMAGMPFKEPIVPYGPFVMNTVEEIQQTLEELRNGTFVQIANQTA